MKEKRLKQLKYSRICKLLSCSQPFETNREWQYFHDPDCQQAWQQLMRRAKADLIMDIERCKADIKKIHKKIGSPTKKEMEWQDK
jgi:hypothetical protein